MRWSYVELGSNFSPNTGYVTLSNLFKFPEPFFPPIRRMGVIIPVSQCCHEFNFDYMWKVPKPVAGTWTHCWSIPSQLCQETSLLGF